MRVKLIFLMSVTLLMTLAVSAQTVTRERPDRIQRAVHYLIELMNRETDAVIGDAVFLELYARIFSERSPLATIDALGLRGQA